MSHKQKSCVQCGVLTATTEFYKRPDTPDRLNYYCKLCDKHRRKLAARGISEQDYQKLWAECQGKCSICHKYLEMPLVDHCHETGIVRGLLCSHCNLGLGHFQDSVSLLTKAVAYLKSNT